jgi:hypothetical protein
MHSLGVGIVQPGGIKMTIEQQGLLEIPVWLVMALAVLGGVMGEMWRADKEGTQGWSLVRRLILRSGSSMMCGVSVVMLLYAANVSAWTAGALGGLTAVAGADFAIGVYRRWVARRINVVESIAHDRGRDRS